MKTSAACAETIPVWNDMIEEVPDTIRVVGLRLGAEALVEIQEVGSGMLLFSGTLATGEETPTLAGTLVPDLEQVGQLSDGPVNGLFRVSAIVQCQRVHQILLDMRSAAFAP